MLWLRIVGLLAIISDQDPYSRPKIEKHVKMCRGIPARDASVSELVILCGGADFICGTSLS